MTKRIEYIIIIIIIVIYVNWIPNHDDKYMAKYIIIYV